jgi:hypothetical protein
MQEAALGGIWRTEMVDDDDREWTHVHTSGLPSTSRAVVVLVALKDGKFAPDIGRYYGADGWSLNFWKDCPVIAWDNIPDFMDHTEIVEVEEAA